MLKSWWELPGPARFLSLALSGLREGKNVILCVPSHSPPLLNSVRSLVEEDQCWTWTSIHIDEEEDADPIDLLFSRFVGSIPPNALRNVETLLRQETFAGRIIYLDEICGRGWDRWKGFLEEYAHGCRVVPQLQRTLFCICLSGEVAGNPPREDVCLAVQRYDDHASHIDSLLYALFLLDDRRLAPLQRRLAGSIIASLAMWDAPLAQTLASQPLDKILEPITTLREVAKERSWPPLDASAESTLWACGMKAKFDGAMRVHSAALAASGRCRDVEQRIWSAEVGVLFPYIEEKRQQLVDELRTVLSVPFTKRTGEVVSDLRDLEIGHIETQLKTVRIAITPERMRLIECLRQIRNHLSHFQLVPSDLVKSGGVIG